MPDWGTWKWSTRKIILQLCQVDGYAEYAGHASTFKSYLAFLNCILQKVWYIPQERAGSARNSNRFYLESESTTRLLQHKIQTCASSNAPVELCGVGSSCEWKLIYCSQVKSSVAICVFFTWVNQTLCGQVSKWRYCFVFPWSLILESNYTVAI